MWLLCLSFMMTLSNGNIFRVTGHFCGEFTGPRWFPGQRPVTRSFDVFFDLHLNKWLSKQSWGWWFETLSCPLWCHCNGCYCYHFTAVFAKFAFVSWYEVMTQLWRHGNGNIVTLTILPAWLHRKLSKFRCNQWLKFVKAVTVPYLIISRKYMMTMNNYKRDVDTDWGGTAIKSSFDSYMFVADDIH